MPAVAERSFELTDARVQLNNWIAVGAASVSAALSIFVLASAAWIYSKKWARYTINRLSFRLFLWSMLFELGYDFSYIAVGVISDRTQTPEPYCATGVYWMMSTLGTVNYLCTCIALNLMLIVCFKINPLEKGLEWWYVGVSAFLGFFIPIVPAGLKHFGWDPVLDVCWIKAGDDRTRLKYFVLDLYLWQILSCVVASLAVIATLIALLHLKRTNSARNATGASQIGTEYLETEQKGVDGSLFARLETRFFRIACLISLYPITLIIVNGIITIGDLYLSAKQGVHNRATYALYCLYYFLYGGRGIFFAFLGIFVDPCLRKGLKAVWKGPQHDVNQKPAVLKPNHKQSLLDILGPPPVTRGYHGDIESGLNPSLPDLYDFSRKESRDSLDMSAALSTLPLVQGAPKPIFTPSKNSKSKAGPSTLAPKDYTKSFSGVRAENLPVGLTDEVDVARHFPLSTPLHDTQQNAIIHEELLPLEPDLPDAQEEKLRRLKAEQVDREEAIRQFEETKAQL